MANLSDFLPLAGGGGLTPKFQEFNSSGTFTPTQELIDAGGYIEILLVGGGGRGASSYYGGCGGEVLIRKMYLTSVTGCSVTIGAGGAGNALNGGSSSFSGASAGGDDITASGGNGYHWLDNKLSSGWPGQTGNYTSASGNGFFGYGAGGAAGNFGGHRAGKANSGQGSQTNYGPGSGYCLIKWYE